MYTKKKGKKNIAERREEEKGKLKSNTSVE
jgi:hypothetical protein